VKKLLLIIFVIASIAKQSHSQINVYHPFPDSNAVWNEAYTYLQNNTPVNNPQIYFLAGDTIISNVSYSKVLTSGYKYYMTPSNNCCFYYNQYAGAIRQDINQRKIYVASPDSLLYDFNLNLGDTLPLSIINYQGSGNYVSSIDSILIGITFRKQYHISTNIDPNGFGSWDSNYVQLIEGIGSTFGLFSPLSPPFEGGCNLSCYFKNNVVLFTNPNSSCDLTVGIHESNTMNRLISISPNPFSSTTTLQSDKPFNNAILTIYNAFGQEVRSLVIGRSPFVIERSGLPSGLYFIRLVEDNKIVATEKLVVTDN